MDIRLLKRKLELIRKNLTQNKLDQVDRLWFTDKNVSHMRTLVQDIQILRTTCERFLSVTDTEYQVIDDLIERLNLLLQAFKRQAIPPQISPKQINGKIGQIITYCEKWDKHLFTFRRLIIACGSHTNEMTAPIIGKSVYEALKADGYPVDYHIDTRSSNRIENRLRKAYVKYGPLPLFDFHTPNSSGFVRAQQIYSEIDFNPEPFDTVLPVRNKQDLYIFFHNCQPESFRIALHKAKFPKKINRFQYKIMWKKLTAFGDSIVFFYRQDYKQWTVEIPAFWKPVNEGPWKNYLAELSEDTVKYPHLHRFTEVDVDKTRELVNIEEQISKIVEGIKKILVRYQY